MNLCKKCNESYQKELLISKLDEAQTELICLEDYVQDLSDELRAYENAK